MKRLSAEMERVSETRHPWRTVHSLKVLQASTVTKISNKKYEKRTSEPKRQAMQTSNYDIKYLG